MANSSMEQILHKYEEERLKRVQNAQAQKGLGQYLDASNTAGHIANLAGDPWVKAGTAVNHPVSEGGSCKYTIIGAGFGGLLAAARLIQQGQKPEDILFVDNGGGFGGTWWANRYPGLMCDVEAYIYLPLLEETGFIPSNKYAGGEEIRQYAASIAKHFGIENRAQFQSNVTKLQWLDTEHKWSVSIRATPKGGSPTDSKITSNFVILAAGPFPAPKIPATAGLKGFKGHMFHTSRWDYEYTGGIAGEFEPELSKLSDKKVAFVGTGATGVQVVPALAKYAKELYVFQRTPSTVAVRDNKPTDANKWKTDVANKKGWWLDRNENFHAFAQYAEPPPKIDLVNDGWTAMPSYGPVFGSPRDINSNNVEQWTKTIHELDLKRSQDIRERARNTVKSAETARKLQAWYPSYCKRPCFHDGYLQAFNNPNVHLVDAEDGKGVERVTDHGLVAGGQEYPVDVIVWGTGYTSPLAGTLASRSGIEIIGPQARDFNQEAAQGKVNALHGLLSPGFPNLFISSLSQAGVGPNQTHRMDIFARHIAYIIDKITKERGQEDVVIEATEEAAEEWAQRVASTALTGVPMHSCPPSYFNGEGDFAEIPPELAARLGLWGRGVNDYARVLGEWQAKGDLAGIRSSAVKAN